LTTILTQGAGTGAVMSCFALRQRPPVPAGKVITPVPVTHLATRARRGSPGGEVLRAGAAGHAFHYSATPRAEW